MYLLRIVFIVILIVKFPPAVSMWRGNYNTDGHWITGVNSTFVNDIVNRLRSLESLDVLPDDELKEIAKLLGEPIFSLRRSGLIKKILPWFELAKKDDK